MMINREYHDSNLIVILVDFAVKTPFDSHDPRFQKIILKRHKPRAMDNIIRALGLQAHVAAKATLLPTPPLHK